MKSQRFARLLTGIVLFGFTIFSFACKMDAPPSIYSVNVEAGPSPVITSIDPAAGGIAGISELRIFGSNFSPIDSLNHVFVDTAQVKVDSATTTMLIVKAPKGVVGNSLKIKVTVDGAFKVALYSQYKIEELAQEYGSFGDLDEVISIAVDKNENLYAQVRVHADTVKIVKVTPSGSKTNYASKNIPVQKFSQLKFGPNGFLYCQRSTSKELYRIPPGGNDSASLFHTLPIARGSFFDFDSLGNLYCSGRTAGMAVLSLTTQTSRTVGNFVPYDVRGLRVYNGYVYILAVQGTKKGVFRAKITSANGDLGSIDTVFNLSSLPQFANPVQIMGFAISSAGDILVGAETSDPIYVVRNGTAVPLYPGLLVKPAGEIQWGAGKYIYVNRYNSNSNAALVDPSVRRVMRIITDSYGAPEYGN